MDSLQKRKSGSLASSNSEPAVLKYFVGDTSRYLLQFIPEKLDRLALRLTCQFLRSWIDSNIFLLYPTITNSSASMTYCYQWDKLFGLTLETNWFPPEDLQNLVTKLSSSKIHQLQVKEPFAGAPTTTELWVPKIPRTVKKLEVLSSNFGDENLRALGEAAHDSLQQLKISGHHSVPHISSEGWKHLSTALTSLHISSVYNIGPLGPFPSGITKLELIDCAFLRNDDLQLLPPSLRNLTIARCVEVNDPFPILISSFVLDKIEYLSFEGAEILNFRLLALATGLTELKLNMKANRNLVNSDFEFLPTQLTSLTIDGKYAYVTEEVLNYIPPNLKSVDASGLYLYQFMGRTELLPPNITSVTMGRLSTSLKSCSRFPDTLTQLVIGLVKSTANMGDLYRMFPNHLKILHLSTQSNNRNLDSQWSEVLQRGNQILDFGKLPRTLVDLRVYIPFDTRTIYQLPSTLQHLELNCSMLSSDAYILDDLRQTDLPYLRSLSLQLVGFIDCTKLSPSVRELHISFREYQVQYLPEETIIPVLPSEEEIREKLKLKRSVLLKHTRNEN